MKKCPFCAEEIQDKAVKCSHCNGILIRPEMRQLGAAWADLSETERQQRWVNLDAQQQRELTVALQEPQQATPEIFPQPQKGKSGPFATWAWVIFIFLVLIGLLSRSDKGGRPEVLPLESPYDRPFQYIGMPTQDAAIATGGTPNEGDNIIVESEEARLFLESSDGAVVSYVEVDLLSTAPCRQDRQFNSESVLRVLDVNIDELELARKQTHFHTYQDHGRKLRVTVSCDYDGGPLTAGFGGRYYGM